MDRRRDTKQANVEVDRLSGLPNDLIHKILSLNGLKCAIGNSVLSSRWRYIWTSMPCLDFSSKDFSTLPKFLEYITNVLSRRDNLGNNDQSVGVFSECLNLKNLIIDSVEVKGLDVLDICHPLLSDLTLKYVMGSLIGFNVLLESKEKLPLSLFNSQSLKHLTLISELIDGSFETYCKFRSLTTTSTLSLPSLTTLYLANVTLCNEGYNDLSVGVFSECPNLKNLIIDSVVVKGLDVLDICHPLLSNLTLKYVRGSLNGVDVVAPQLKNLTIRHSTLEDLQYFFGEGEEVAYAHRMLRLLQQLQSAKFLTLSIEIIEFLSSSRGTYSGQPSSPFTNLKMLKIYPENVNFKEQAEKKVNMSMETC
ncbi:F-box domain containing protein [Tanacetum coccineum]|uniref:F-box domain containing protein n=1 Tax=Tanacetum coccineum TaxID=301880 RepID=A0ABQ4Z5U9_9ASTR